MLIIYIIIGISFLGTIAYFIRNYINYIKICTPIKDSDRIIISNLECISIIFELLYINPELEDDIIKAFMETFNPNIEPNKENFNKYMTNVMNTMGYSFSSSYYNLIYVNIQVYLALKYINITNNCDLYLLLGKYRFSPDFVNKIKMVIKNKKIVDTTNQYLLEDLLNIYLYYELKNCTLNKKMFNTTVSGEVLFENSVLYRMFTCFNEL